MRYSVDDKIVTIRFNYREQEMLNFLVTYCYKYSDDGIGSIIKRILWEEYKRQKEKRGL